MIGPEGLPPEERKEDKRPADRSFRPHAVLEYRCGRHNRVWLPEMTA